MLQVDGGDGRNGGSGGRAAFYYGTESYEGSYSSVGGSSLMVGLLNTCNYNTNNQALFVTFAHILEQNTYMKYIHIILLA